MHEYDELEQYSVTFLMRTFDIVISEVVHPHISFVVLPFCFPQT